ncbi:hypothetical protein [Serinicoccus kebangsaanensis]|uniref:hypothetical protein n=1 Tax=Serinicoccus kebangsaanensis TaxID=2602069 RepID=UPI00124CEC1A|nr:hypothetical protein [Serinicoccus kebangsaanensis]
MSGVAKLSPLESFKANMEDAHHLVRLAEGFTNQRAYRMRRELRERVGDAMRIPAKQRGELDCLESGDVLVVFKPGSGLSRAHFSDHKPLLRQALVAACAATETYLSDKAIERAGVLLRANMSATDRMRKVPLTVGDWLDIETDYQRRRRGLRERVMVRHINELASTSPSKLGELLSLIGITKWTNQMDHHRKVPKGTSFDLLERITKRRNKIVHTGDRHGRGRAPLTVTEVKQDLEALESVVEALEAMIA